MLVNIEETFALIFDKNNNIAYKALQELQKESDESDKVYCYMDKLADMINSDNSYIRTRGLTLIAWDCQEQAGIKRRYRFRTTKGGYIYLCRKYAVIGL